MTSNEISCSTRGPSAEYRAESFSTIKLPLAGQYAGGMQAAVGFGSCSIVRYCWMRSKLFPLTSNSFKRRIHQRIMPAKPTTPTHVSQAPSAKLSEHTHQPC